MTPELQAIAQAVKDATHRAHQRALSLGPPVYVVEGHAIFEIHKDRPKVLIKELEKIDHPPIPKFFKLH